MTLSDFGNDLDKLVKGHQGQLLLGWCVASIFTESVLVPHISFEGWEKDWFHNLVPKIFGRTPEIRHTTTMFLRLRFYEKESQIMKRIDEMIPTVSVAMTALEKNAHLLRKEFMTAVRNSKAESICMAGYCVGTSGPDVTVEELFPDYAPLPAPIPDAVVRWQAWLCQANYGTKGGIFFKSPDGFDTWVLRTRRMTKAFAEQSNLTGDQASLANYVVKKHLAAQPWIIGAKNFGSEKVLLVDRAQAPGWLVDVLDSVAKSGTR